MSKREQIVSAIVAALAGTTGVGTRIFRSREDALERDEAPALVIRPESDEPQTDIVGITEKKLTVTVGIYTRGAIPDQLADATADSVHSKIMASPTLGGLAIDIEEGAASWDFDEADLTAGWLTMRYIVWYRHQRGNLAL